MEKNQAFVQVLVDTLKLASQYNRNDQVGPAAVLWPDEQRQWAPLLPLLRDRLPLLTLGDYDPEARTGPAYWVRCMIERTLPEDQLPESEVPIIYLPGYGKQDLRAIESCPKPLQPLAELQYRGTLWVHRNGRDWTVTGFLHSQDIPVLADSETKAALARALPRLAREPLASLRKQAPLDAAFLNGLLHPDPVRQMLLWLSDPDGFMQQLNLDEWSAFCALSRHQYGLDPERDGALTAAKALSRMTGAWAMVWQRYTEAPEAYPGIPDLLERTPQGQLSFAFEPSEASPRYNRAQEEALRNELAVLSNRLPKEARKRLEELEAVHGQRRNWVWAKLGQTPLAQALAHLVSLAQLAEAPLGGVDVTEIAEAYTDHGWQVDATVLDALASVQRQQDAAAVKGAIDALYQPWLSQVAVQLQNIVFANPTANYVTEPLPSFAAGTCLLFTDALRYDVGRRLVAELTRRGWDSDVGWRLAALPTITGTAKPLVSPAAGGIRGPHAPGLTPVVAETGTSVTADSLRKLIQSAGWQVLSPDDLGDGSGRAWMEAGALDSYGHQHGWRVAHHARDEIRGLVDLVEALLKHGWQQVVLVTDHGWLLLPGGLPKVDLSVQVTKIRKGRCAVIKPDATTDQQTVPWHWNPETRIAIAPGIACYEAGKEYEHGGISPQECIVPVITVKGGAGAPAKVAIEDVSWRGLRCYVKLSLVAPNLTVDLRLKAGDPNTSVALEARAPDADGKVSLIVPDEDYEGGAAFVVVLSGESLVAQQLTTVGE